MFRGFREMWSFRDLRLINLDAPNSTLKSQVSVSDKPVPNVGVVNFPRFRFQTSLEFYD